jgi:hypothetical protein
MKIKRRRHLLIEYQPGAGRALHLLQLRAWNKFAA